MRRRTPSAWSATPSPRALTVATLLLLNGPPGVGKSTLARRYVDDHPLALTLEIDGLRTSLGRWRELAESRLVARRLALAMAEEHLRTGHDVVVPQYLGRRDFIESLEAVAQRAGAAFCELLLLDAEVAVIDRFRARRASLAAAGEDHPQIDLGDDDVAAAVADAFERLRIVRSERPSTVVIEAGGGPEAAYEQVLRSCDSLSLRAVRQRSEQAWPPT